MENILRIIGDVHGKHQDYIDLAKEAKYSIAIGDVGFDYDLELKKLDPKFHKILGGNHDNYDVLPSIPHYLGDFGTYNVPGFGDLFFVRGAFSIDKIYRVEGISWWQNEEIAFKDMNKVISAYKKAKPKFVLSHDCPSTLIKIMYYQDVYKTRTTAMLQNMYENHSPKNWVFGHHHKTKTWRVCGTNFKCLAELHCMDFKLD